MAVTISSVIRPRPPGYRPAKASMAHCVDNPLRDGNHVITAMNRDDATRRFTELDPSVLDQSDLRFFDDTELMCIHTRDGAWAEADITAATSGYHSITQGGSRQVWDRVEQVAALWFELGRPRADHFGLTVTAENQRLWLDKPEFKHTWLL
jgi:hypothetical protein